MKLKSLLMCLALLGPLIPGTTAHSRSVASRSVPQLADVPENWSQTSTFLQKSRLTPDVKESTYGGAVSSHPLVARAAMILTRELNPYAGGVFITSLTRAPHDQHRLKKARRYRRWTIDRSKHLMGLAVDVGFYRRHITMSALHYRAKYVLRKHLGDVDYNRLRVVREARCLHVELNTKNAREEIEDRSAALLSAGILLQAPTKHIVPSLKDYVPEDLWLRTPRNRLIALAH